MIIKNGMYLSNLQSYLFGFILILFMGFIACEKSNEELPSIDFGKTTLLGANETVNYASSSDNNVKLKLTSLIDNFCPKGVTCVVVGYAEVKLSATNQNTQNIVFSLFYGDYYGTPKKLGFKPDTLDFNLNQKEYRAILKSIKSGNTDNDLKAEIVLFEK